MLVTAHPFDFGRELGTDDDIPKDQRRKPRTLAQLLQSCENREQALYNAQTQRAMTMSAIARELAD